MEFPEAIDKFNKMYKLPAPEQATLAAVGDVRKRIQSFQVTLRREIEEGNDIIDRMNHGQAPIDTLVDLADWLGDLVVYATSEARKYGLPMPHVLSIIMQSNFSKQNRDGSTSYDEFGKVLKGPDYWKPEPKIKELLENYHGKVLP